MRSPSRTMRPFPHAGPYHLGLLGRFLPSRARPNAQGRTLYDNDSWSTNEVAIDWQGSALYSLYFAQWMAKRPAH